MVHFGNDWDTILDGEFAKTYYQNLRQFLLTEYRTQTIYPGMYDIFNALKYTPYSQVRAVILGQDPYHNPDQAHGLSFSVRKGVAPPPSLVNIFKEIKDDVGIDNTGKHGELTNWAKHGVLLLNTVLTVRAGQAKSHFFFGCVPDRRIPKKTKAGSCSPMMSFGCWISGKNRWCSCSGATMPRRKRL